jgi:hypothetical protein
MTVDDPLNGWAPIRVDLKKSPPEVDWCELGRERFTDPFFEQTISRRLRDPFPLLFRRRSTLDALVERLESRPGLPPAAFIFHMSRCGSTLVAQMFAALSHTVVISEADPIDAVLRARFSDGDRIAWLRGMVAALGQPRRGDETHLIIKFDSWNTLDLPLIREAFPRVPWAFVYRDPVEVLVSQVRQRAVYMIPGRLGREPVDPAAALEALTKPEEHCAKILGSFCQAALERHRQDPGLILNYRELPQSVESRLLNAFRIVATEEDRARMRSASQLNAKTPQLQFESDSESKNRAASDLLRRMADRWIRPAYEELEAERQTQST